jgi:hypothetical protein
MIKFICCEKKNYTIIWIKIIVHEPYPNWWHKIVVVAKEKITVRLLLSSKREQLINELMRKCFIMSAWLLFEMLIDFLIFFI